MDARTSACPSGIEDPAEVDDERQQRLMAFGSGVPWTMFVSTTIAVQYTRVVPASVARP